MPDRAPVNLDIVNLDIDPRSQPKSATLAPDAPFRILVLGNFSGRGTPVADASPIDIDPDNFEQVMESLGVELHLTAASAPLTLQFRELDDFDPDHLYQTLPLFRAFRDTRRQLEDPQTFGAAAARFAPPPVASSLSLLDAITGESDQPAKSPQRPAFDDNWDNVIRRILAGHTIPARNPRQDDLIAQVDTAAAAELRAILHHPDFQSLESAWRSLFLMFRRVETSVDLKIYIADISQPELTKDLPALHRILNEEAWSAVAGLYTFSPTEIDCEALAQIAKLAAAAHAPFFAAMHPSLFGCESIAATPDPDDWDRPLPPEAAAAWQRLRRSPEAVWLGLAMPRFLLRLPYGQDSAPIESFDFEESPAHENYLWGNPAVACACLLGEAFNRAGWRSSWNMPTRIDGMPIHVHESEAKPQAEIWMTDRLASRMMAEGIMPLASIKNTDSIQLLRFQSISDPPRPPAAPW